MYHVPYSDTTPLQDTYIWTVPWWVQVGGGYVWNATSSGASQHGTRNPTSDLQVSLFCWTLLTPGCTCIHSTPCTDTQTNYKIYIGPTVLYI